MGDLQLLPDPVNEALQVVQTAVVGRLLAVGLYPVQISLAQFVERRVVRRDGGRIGHHLMEFGKRRILVFAKVDLLAAGGEIPALGLLAEEGLWLPWHRNSPDSCMKRAFDVSMIQKNSTKAMFCRVGMTRFELATSAPPVQRSNQAEPHPVKAKTLPKFARVR